MLRVALLRPQEQVLSDVCMGAEKWSKGFMKETCEDLTGAGVLFQMPLLLKQTL